MSIVKATRANYAALQHRKAPDRIELRAVLVDSGGDAHHWVYWVKATTNAQRVGALTRTHNRLRAMYPSARYISCSFP